jgi:hypothetical protein
MYIFTDYVQSISKYDRSSSSPVENIFGKFNLLWGVGDAEISGSILSLFEFELLLLHLKALNFILANFLVSDGVSNGGCITLFLSLIQESLELLNDSIGDVKDIDDEVDKDTEILLFSTDLLTKISSSLSMTSIPSC